MSNDIFMRKGDEIRGKQCKKVMDFNTSQKGVNVCNNAKKYSKLKNTDGSNQMFADLSSQDIIFENNLRAMPADCLSSLNENESDNNISSCSTLDIDQKETGCASKVADLEEDIYSDEKRSNILISQIPKSFSCLCCDNRLQSSVPSDCSNAKCSYVLITEAPKPQQNNFVVTKSVPELEQKIKELLQKLAEANKERDDLQKKLNDAEEERDRSYMRLDAISTAHESRITEMHCVIAELSKKLRNKQESIILEENEPEDSEFSFHEESIYNSETNLTNPDAECQTEPLEIEVLSESHALNETIMKTQVEALQEEILRLKSQIALLQSQISNINSAQAEAISPTGESNELFNVIGVQEAKLREINCVNTENFVKHTNLRSFNASNIFLETEGIMQNKAEAKVQIPIPKMAERVKLRRTVERFHITGNDILNNGIKNTEIVEHLVSDITHGDYTIESLSDTCQLQNELQRLERRTEHYKLRNSILSLTLDECKEHCEHLYLLCGKYESNAVALQLALNCSDRAIEAYDVMLALLESKLALIKEKTPASQESRKAVEAVARHLLERLESEKNIHENSLGPWQNTVCITNTQLSEPWTTDDDNRLRNHVSKLKGRRSAVQNTVVILEPPFSPQFEKVRLDLEINKETQKESHHMDLEMAVLMQELMSLREDVMQSRRRLETTEKEKNLAMEKIFILEEALSHLQSQLTDSETLLSLTTQDRSSYSEAEHATIIERQLVEALTRESQLKSRIQTLIGSVSTSKKITIGLRDQAPSSLADPDKLSTNVALEQCKKKYLSKIRRLEQRILQMSAEGASHGRSKMVPETTL